MAPRPKTYGARRSYIKPAGQPINGTTADESENKPGKIDFISMRIRTGRENGNGAVPKEEQQNMLSQGLRKEDALASGTTVEACTGPEHRKMSAQDILPSDTPGKQQGLRRKSVRRSVDGSAAPQHQNLLTENGFQPMPLDDSSPSDAKATSVSNGVTEDHKHPSVDHDINLNGRPSDFHNLGIWVAQSIKNCHQDMTFSPVTSEQRQTDVGPQPGQHIETTDALENVEDVRMTRGKEKKRLQQLKVKELANGNAPTDLSGKFITGSGRSLALKNATPVERLLKDQLNDQLKQRLFGSSNTTDVSTKIIDRNACGTLLFNTLVDIDDLDHNPAALLNTALEERKDDTPFVSALNILALSSEVMSFINFYYSKEDARLWELPKVGAGSRLSIRTETSGATTVTDVLPDRPGTPLSNPEESLETTTRNRAMNNKNTGKEKRSREIIQAFEAATTILVQIQQGEAGSNYVTPYASASVFPNPVGQHLLTGHGTAYGSPFPNHPTHGMVYGPPVGPTINNYAPPFVPHLAQHPNSYAYPYSNPVAQPPAKYASPYDTLKGSDPTGFVGGANNQTKDHTGVDSRHEIMEAHTTKPSVTGPEAKKKNPEAASQHISRQKEATGMSSAKADKLSNGNEKKETRAFDRATGQGISNGKVTVGNVVDLDETNVGESKKQDGIGEVVETNSGNDSTDDDLPVATLNNKNVTPPAEDHKLFTGERLGDFTSVEKIDWLLTIGNGGKMPTPRKKRATKSPPESPSFQADDEIRMEVGKIIDEIMLYKGWPGHPGATTKQLFYASVEGQRLAAELKRLMVIAKPVVNAIVPKAEGEARLRFYQQLESRTIKEKRDREFQGGINQFHGPPVQIQQWTPPVMAPNFPFPVSQQLPSNGPMEVPFVRRGNVITAPLGGRNIEEEQKAETYGYPPTPGSRPGDSHPRQKRKRPGKH